MALSEGQIEEGNIDLINRPRVVDPVTGETSTVLSAGLNFDGREVLVPRVTDDGRIVSPQEAGEIYRKTGKHLGIFKDVKSAKVYADRLHLDQEALISPDWEDAPVDQPTQQTPQPASQEEGWLDSPLTPEIQLPEKETIQQATRQGLETFFSVQPNATYAGSEQPGLVPGKPVVALPEGHLHHPDIQSAYDAKATKIRNFYNAIGSGLQVSIGGLLVHGRPTMLLPEDAPHAYRIAAGLTSAIADWPIMAVGGAVGGAMGAISALIASAPVPGVQPIAGLGGGALGAAAGGFGLPAAWRTALLEHYERNSGSTLWDMWEASAPILIDGVKETGVGLATLGTGSLVKKGLLGTTIKGLAPVLSKPIVRTPTVIASEVAAMVGVGKALNNEPIPKNISEYTDAAAIVFLLHGVSLVKPGAEKLAEKYPALKNPLFKNDIPTTLDNAVDHLRNLRDDLPNILNNAATKIKRIWEKTGIPPAQVEQDVVNDPHLRQELLADGDKIPARYEPEIDPPAPEIPAPEYKGTGDVKEMDGIARQMVERIRDGEFSPEAMMDEVLPYEFNLDKADLEYISEKVNHTLDNEQPFEAREIELTNENAGEKNAVLDDLPVPNKIRIEPDRTLEKGMAVTTRSGNRGVVQKIWPDGKVAVLHESGTTGIYPPDQLAPRVPRRRPGDPPAVPPTPPPPPPKPPSGDGPRSYEEIKKQIRSQVVTRPKKERTFSFKDLYEKYVDLYYHVGDAVRQMTQGKNLPAAEDPYKLLRLAVDFIGKGTHFLKYGTFDFETLKDKNLSLAAILAPHEAEREDLTDYLIAERHKELSARGLKSGFDMTDEEADIIIEKDKGRFEETAKKLRQYEDDLLDYLRGAGRFSEEELAVIKKLNEAHIPLYRITQDGDQIGGTRKGLTGKVLSRFTNQEGGRLTVDPIESITRNTFEYIRLAELNRAWVKFIELAETSLVGREPPYDAPHDIKPEDVPSPFARRVKQAVRPIEVSNEELAREINKQFGLPEGEQIDPAVLEAFKIFRPLKKQLREDEIAIWRNGKMEVWEVNEGVARAFRAADNNVKAMNFAFRIAALPAKVLRTTLGLTPDFIVRNFLRDQITAGQYSKYAEMPVLESLFSLKELFSDKDNSEAYKNWLKSGGTSGNFVSIDRDYVSQNVWEIQKKTHFMDAAYNVIRHPMEFFKVGTELARDYHALLQTAKMPVEAIRGLSEYVENSTRFAEFKRVTQGNYDTHSIFEGGFASREITVDFQRRGAAVAAWNMVTAFWNANVQGLDRAARAFTEKPLETGLRTGLSITLPSLLLWISNHNDPRWKEIPRWEKDLFWIFMTKDHIYRVPKPFEVGVLFGSLPERSMEAFFTDNPHAMKDFMDSILQVGIPGFLPTAIVPIIEQWAIKSTFTGHSIVNDKLQGLKGQYQYMPYTTQSARVMANVIGSTFLADYGPENAPLSSPQVIENYIRAWSGNFGMYALKVADQVLIGQGKALQDLKRQGFITSETLDKIAFKDPNRPELPWGQSPFWKAFQIQYPSMSAQGIQDFYEYYSGQKRYKETITHLEDSGDTKNLEKELLDPANKKWQIFDLNPTKEALSRIITLTHMIEVDEQMLPHEKRQQLNELYMQATMIARETVDSYEKILKEEKAK